MKKSLFDTTIEKLMEQNNPTFGGFQTSAANRGGVPVAAPAQNNVLSQRRKGFGLNDQTNAPEEDEDENTNAGEKQNQTENQLENALKNPEFFKRLQQAFNDPNTRLENPEDFAKLFSK